MEKKYRIKKADLLIRLEKLERLHICLTDDILMLHERVKELRGLLGRYHQLPPEEADHDILYRSIIAPANV